MMEITITFYEAFILGAGVTVGSFVVALPLIIINALFGD